MGRLLQSFMASRRGRKRSNGKKGKRVKRYTNRWRKALWLAQRRWEERKRQRHPQDDD
jgi:hypothetical protein